MHVHRIVALGLLLGLVIGLVPGPAQPASSALMQPAGGTLPLVAAHPALTPESARVVRISFESREQLARLAARLDIWEIVESGPEGRAGVVTAHITDMDAAWLEGEGFVYAPHTAPGLTTIKDYPCYRTIDELHAQLAAWAAAYPALTELRAIGSSYEGRPLLALRLTNKATGPDKPVFLLIANIHGRELITPEAAMQFIARLLAGYSADPDLTWILDHQIVEVLVSANPDGHVRNEGGQPWSYWRKNANPTYGACSGTDFGVDLNRNSTWRWGGVGTSTYPCDLVYRGPTAGSELETQAVESFLRSLFLDERPPDTTTPAPEDKPGLFITLHSYSDLVLWPWGDTYTPAPNGPALTRLGRKMATFNGYIAKQSSQLYPTSGATDDFAYGELGVAAFTFEIGGDSDGFYPSCSRYDALIEPNLDALLYAAKVARAPYLLPAGPDAQGLFAETGGMDGTPVVTVTAYINDGANGNDRIAAAEVYVDTPPWLGGNARPLSPVDGAFDSSGEHVAGTLPLDMVAAGRRQLYVRGQDAGGAWGPVSSTFLTVTGGLSLSPPTIHRLTRPETVMTHTLTLSNRDSLSRTVSLTLTGATWPALLTPALVHLSPGAVTPVTLTITVPPIPPAPSVERFTLTATSTHPVLSTAAAEVEIHALWVSLMLPWVEKRP